MNLQTVSGQDAVLPEFLSGGGEMGELIRSKDWSKTPLGTPDTWPQSLRTTVSTCLNSRFPILIWWGPELVMIYNDAYRPILGKKHPASMGEKGKQVWPEVWDIIGPMLNGVYEQGISTWSENQLLLLDRNGYVEECYFTFSYSPIYVENGGIGGVYCAVTETTQTVLNERQSQTLRELSNLETSYKTVDKVYEAAAKVLEKNSHDFPFAVIYKINAEGSAAQPIAYSGVDEKQIAFPDHIDLLNPVEGVRNFCHAFKTSSIVISENRGRRKNIPTGAWEKEATHFVHIPIVNAAGKFPHAILSAPLNPHRIYDESFRQFTKLMADQIALEINNVIGFEEERKRAEALAEIDKAKTLFFSNVSHEFRTPLTLMLGSIEELLSKNKNELLKDHESTIETAHRNAMRLLRLVNNLLDFSRIEAGRVKARFQLTDIARYTTDLASNFRSAIEKAGLSFQINTDAIIQPVYIDKEMWEKIVLNLLSNAFKYTLSGSITVSLDTAPLAIGEGRGVRLKVKDTGAGISEEELPKMFERFHRIGHTVGRTYEGTGIGLSLVKELVNLHGGTVSVNSTTGVGSEFIVTIPTGKLHLPSEQIVEKEVEFNAVLAEAFIEEANTLIENSFKDDDHTDQNKEEHPTTILIVDDNADMREHLKSILGKHYHVITAGNGMNALYQVQKHSPQLIVSDIMMPVMDGISLLRSVKENPNTSHIPVVLLSARAGEEAKIEGYDIGADDYLVKPFSAKELLARVRSHLNIARLRHENEQNIKNFFIQAPAAIAVVHGDEHVFTIANSLYQKLFGRTEEQLIGRSMKQVWPEIEGQGIYELFDQVFASGEAFVAHEFPASFMENDAMRNGYFDFIAQPIKDTEGKVTDIMIHAFEVTEQIMAHRKMEESKEQLRIALEGGELGTYDFYPQSGELVWSAKTKELFGLPPDAEVNFEIYLKGLHPDDRETTNAALQNAIHRKSNFYENDYRTIGITDGKLRWIRSKAKVHYDEEGKAVRMIGVVQDITKYKETFHSLQQSEERLRLLSEELELKVKERITELAALNKVLLVQNETFKQAEESSGQGSYSFNLTTGILDYSDNLYRLLGYEPGEFKPALEEFYKHVHTEDREYVSKAAEDVLQTKQAEEWRYRMIRKNDEIIHIKGTGRVISWNDELLLVGTLQNITVDVLLKQTLQTKNRELERSNEDLQQFAHVASHDLKEPLRKIKTFGSRIKSEFENDLPGKAKTYIGKIETAANRMYDMIDGILLYSSLNADRILDDNVDLNEVMKNVENDLEVVIQKKAANFNYRNLSIVQGSGILMYQLFYNLISNSLKFSKTDEPSCIRIESKTVSAKSLSTHKALPSNQDYVHITIQDNGIGFDQSQTEKIFKTFTRLNSKDQYEGTGLGLALCKKIVERHNGIIYAEGKENEGATFTIILPAK